MTEPDHHQSASATGAPRRARRSPPVTGASTGESGARASGGRERRSRRLLSDLGRRTTWAVVGFLAASLVVPAATKQWSDRSDEQLERDLVSDIARVTTETVSTAGCVASQCTYDHLLRGDPTEEAWLQATAELHRLDREAQDEWLASSEEMDVVLRTYFPGSDVLAEWTSFSDTVVAYLRIGTGECWPEREADMELLRARLPTVHEDTWRDLVRDIGPDRQATPAHWPPAYATVAGALLDRRQSLTGGVVRANAAGYSSGWRDFLDDLYPL